MADLQVRSRFPLPLRSFSTNPMLYTAIKDPNTGLTLWESGAIVLYLVEQYDKQKKLTLESVQDRALLTQWLMFQMSGQEPYFGQCGWFNVLHSEKVPSAIERYDFKLRRILEVLDQALAGKQWLVGDKYTFADIFFAPWNDRIDTLYGYPPCAPEDNPIRDFPNVLLVRMPGRQLW